MKTIILLALFGLVLSIEPRESARGVPPIPINATGEPVIIETRGEADWCAKLYLDTSWSMDSSIVDDEALVIEETSLLNLDGKLYNDWAMASWSDKASSARVKPGCTLNLFEDKNNGWFFQSLTADAKTLKKNDKASSVSCTCQAGLKNVGKACWRQGCNKRQGKCDWCGVDGWCCRRGKKWVGNGCDGTRGGNNNHRCVPKDW